MAATVLLSECARIGEYSDWTELKAAILRRLDEIVLVFEEADNRRLRLVASGAALSESALRTARAGLQDLRARLTELRASLDGFRSAPFTVQRLCELLLHPQRQYRFLDKLLAAVEKLLRVTTELPATFFMPAPPAAGAVVEAAVAAAAEGAARMEPAAEAASDILIDTPALAAAAPAPAADPALQLAVWSDAELLRPCQYRAAIVRVPAAGGHREQQQHFAFGSHTMSGARREGSGSDGTGDDDDWLPLARSSVAEAAAGSHAHTAQPDYSRSVLLSDLDELDLPSSHGSAVRGGAGITGAAHYHRGLGGGGGVLDMFAAADDDDNDGSLSPPRRLPSDLHAAHAPQFGGAARSSGGGGTDLAFGGGIEQRERHEAAAHRGAMGALFSSLGSSGGSGGGSTSDVPQSWFVTTGPRPTSRSGSRWQAAGGSGASALNALDELPAVPDGFAAAAPAAPSRVAEGTLATGSGRAGDGSAALRLPSHGGIGVSSGWLGRDAELLLRGRSDEAALPAGLPEPGLLRGGASLTLSGVRLSRGPVRGLVDYGDDDEELESAGGGGGNTLLRAVDPSPVSSAESAANALAETTTTAAAAASAADAAVHAGAKRRREAEEAEEPLASCSPRGRGEDAAAAAGESS